MSIKSRGNWLIKFCLKKDCINRNKKCDLCVKFSEYKKSAKESIKFPDIEIIKESEEYKEGK